MDSFYFVFDTITADKDMLTSFGI